MSADADVRLVYFGQCVQVIDSPHACPRPPSQPRVIVVRIEFDECIRIVRRAIDWVGRIENHTNIAAANGGCDPRTLAWMVRKEHRERALAGARYSKLQV